MTNRRLFAAIVLLACFLGTLTGCGLFGSAAGAPSGPPPGGSLPGPGAPAPDPDPDGSPGDPDAGAEAEADAEAWVSDTLARMTLPEKVGQLFVLYGYGAAADTDDPDAQANNAALFGHPTLAAAVAAYSPGGVIYFGWTGNVGDGGPGQVAALSAGLQRAALASGAGVPLLIGVDQEGGTVARLGPPFTPIPSAMALAAGGDVRAAAEAAAATAAELRAVGINWNFAPVADVNVNPLNPVIGIRSFGSDPQQVAAFVAAQVRGYQQAGIASTVKHFPGHGDTDVDSHTGLPVIAHSREELENLDLPPFVSALAAGVDAVMVAHIAVPALDPSGVPATYSRKIVTGLLREELGYDGVIVTDALDMAGAQAPLPDGRVAVAALQAGADMLLMPPDPVAAIDSVLAAVAAGEIREERIDESVRRILLLKWRRGLVAAAHSGDLTESAADLAVIGRDAHDALARAISERAVTVVKNDQHVLPLVGGPIAVIGPGPEATAVAAGMQQAGLAAFAVTPATPDAAVAGAEQAAATVVLTENAGVSAAQRAVTEAVLAAGAPVVLVALQEPYDLSSFPDVAGYVATYSRHPYALDALVRVLTGEMRPQGRLPVGLPDLAGGGGELYPAGHGLR